MLPFGSPRVRQPQQSRSKIEKSTLELASFGSCEEGGRATAGTTAFAGWWLLYEDGKSFLFLKVAAAPIVAGVGLWLRCCWQSWWTVPLDPIFLLLQEEAKGAKNASALSPPLKIGSFWQIPKTLGVDYRPLKGDDKWGTLQVDIFFLCKKGGVLGLCEIWNGFFFTNVFATFFCDKLKENISIINPAVQDIVDTLLHHSFGWQGEDKSFK